MAKHIVKCAICNRQFDANAESFVKVNSRRYAHEACVMNEDEKKTKVEKTKKHLKLISYNFSKLNILHPKIGKGK